MLKYKSFVILLASFVILGCSTKKNTKTTRLYHNVNTRYNVYFNANEAYKDALKAKESTRDDNLSRMIDVYPIDASALEKQETGGSFDVSVDKTTKAIKTHSITAKPERDPGKRKNKEYQQWLKSQEFNPFLKNAWLLLGKSEYQNNDFLLASSTFSYITRLYKNEPDVVSEARLWLARTYLAMDWLYEAEDVLHNIDLAGKVPNDLNGEYSEIYADLLMRKKEYSKALPYLETAIKSENNKLQKTRLKYLLGQTYAFLGNKERAFKAFESVQGLSTPYNFDFNARIQQAAFVDATNKQKVLSDLEKMSKNPRNKEYLDQIYYAIGNIYLAESDTTKTIDTYKKAIEKSTRNGYDKAITLIALGDIYFKRKEYILAQPCYSEALSGIGKKHEAYPKVELRSAVLDELVVYVEAIQHQDSLQNLAKLPETERLDIINKIIKDLRKKEEQEKKDTQKETREQLADPNTPLFESNIPNIPSGPALTGPNSSSFYFYNPQAVAQGKTAFQKKWGNRKLEDNWRLRNKRSSLLNQNAETDIDTKIETDSVLSNDTNKEVNDQTQKEADKYSVDFYLAEIPLTQKAIDKSNEIIEDAFFNIGKIYKDKLEDYTLAIDAFDTDLRRFPNTPNLEEIYYQLFLIYLRLGNKDMTELYRRNILNYFPKGDYAATLSNEDYEWNLRNIYNIQDNLYQQTYDAYLAGNVNTVRNNYLSIKNKYPLSNLMPKFLYLNALTYAQTNNPNELKENLTELIEKYPKADVTEVASEILKGLLEGKVLSSDNSPSRGMIWDIKFGNGADIEDAAGVDFVANPESEFILLFIYRSKTVNKNQLIYDIANYNFSNFIYKTFDLSFVEANSLEMIQVKGFKSFKEVDEYIDLAFEKNSLMSQLDPSIITVPISTDNYIALMNGKTLNEYFLFFEKNYTKEMVKLILYWDSQRRSIPLDNKNEIDNNEKVDQKEVENTKKEIEKAVEELSPEIKVEEKPKEESKTEIKLEDTEIKNPLSDDIIDKADNIINNTIKIINNPVDGLKGLFNSGGYKPKLTKEEKQALKDARKLEKEEEKARKDEEKARIKAEQEAEKIQQDSVQNAQKEKEKAEQALSDAKESEAKQKIKDKEDARKARQRELKEKEKAQKDKLKQKEKERKEQLKAREQTRKEKERQAKENRKK